MTAQATGLIKERFVILIYKAACVSFIHSLCVVSPTMGLTKPGTNCGNGGLTVTNDGTNSGKGAGVTVAKGWD